MLEPPLDNATVRAIGGLLVWVFDVALAKVGEAVERVRPLLVPPEDLALTTRDGALYSGLLLVEAGKVIAGFVVLAGQQARGPGTAEPAVEESTPLERWSDRPGEDDRVPWRFG